MWIEAVRLEGFKSFRELTEVQFDSGHNLVIGHNGAGKSNLLHAVSSIIDVPAVSREDRQHLISLNSTQARVHVIFNNESRRLPYQTDRVVVVRTFTSKSDEIRVNGTPSSRKDLIKMFESAGISNDNRYNVVKTQDVYTLCQASDADRLSLIQELAGLKVYYETKVRADAAVKGTKEDMTEVSEMLTNIDQRLEKLAIECKQVKKYKKSEKMSVLLEFKLTERQVEEQKQKVAKAEEMLKRVTDDMSERKKEVEVSEKVLHQLSDKMEQENQRRVQMEENKGQLEEGIEELESRYMRGKEEIRDLEKRMTDLLNEGEELSTEMAALEAKRDKTVAALDKIKAQLKVETPEVENLTIDVGSHQKRLNAGSNVADLMSNLDNNRDGLEKQIQVAQAEVTEVQTSLTTKRAELAENQANMAEILNEKDGLSGELEELRAQRQSLRTARINSTEDLTHWQSQCKGGHDNYREMHQRLLAKGGESKNLLLGFDIVQKIFEEHDPEINEGYFGVLADCFTMSEDFLSAAVSSIAGKRLFYHVVSTKVVATKILQRQKQYNMKGEIYCLPLDTINDFNLRQEVRDRLGRSKIGRPLTDMLVPEDPSYQRALNFVWGRFVLVKDTSGFRKVHDLVKDVQAVDCVTVDGDQASGKGVLTGGYYGQNNKLDLYRERENARREMETAQVELRAAETAVMHHEAEAQTLDTQCQKLESQINRLGSVWEERAAQANCTAREVGSLEARLDMAQQALSAKSVALAEVERTRDDVSLGQDREEMAQQLKSLQIRLRKKAADVNDLEKKKAVLANRLANVIEPKVVESRKAIVDNKNLLATTKTKGENLKEMLTEVKKMRLEKAASLNEVDVELDKLVESMLSWQTKREKCKKRRDAAGEQMETIRLEHEGALKRYSRQQKLLEEEIKLLGTFKSVPPAASLAKKLESMSSSEIKKSLDSLKADLQAMGNVNFSAVADYDNSLATRDQYRRQEKDIATEQTSFDDVFENLVDCSLSKIEFTLRQVAKYFKENFDVMGPAGSQSELRLQMAKKSHGPPNSQDSNASQMSWTSSVLDDERRDDEEIIGVVVNVKFKKEEPFQDMRLLSGGQKSLVALALIFAFQKCNQSPVCVLDEVDAALDSAMRKKLADYIRTREGTQFISTTFRKELLESGDQFVGVRFDNGLSKVKTVDAHEARQFVR